MPNDLRITSSGEAVYGDQSPGDFIGHTSTARAVLIECKDIRAPRLALGTRGLKPHQHVSLIELHRCGGIALLIWAKEEVVAVLDPDMIRAIVRPSRLKSIPWDAIHGKWKRPMTENGILDLLEMHNL